MTAFVSRIVEPVARAMREVDAALAAGSISNARAAARESAQRLSLRRAASEIAKDPTERWAAV